MKSSREIRTSKWLCHCTSLHFFLKTESCLSSKTTKYTRRTLTTNVFRWVTARFNYILSSSIADKCHSSFLSTVGYLNPFVHLYIKKNTYKTNAQMVHTVGHQFTHVLFSFG